MKADTAGAMFWLGLYLSLGVLTHCAAGCSVPVVVADPPATCFYAGCDVMIDGEASFLQPDKMSLSECNRAYEKTIKAVNNNDFSLMLHPRFLGYCVGGVDFYNDEVNK